jgi:hypothetical protein
MLADLIIRTDWITAPPALVTTLIVIGIFVWGAFVVHNAISHGYGLKRSLLWFIPMAEQALQVAETVDPASIPIDELGKKALRDASIVLSKLADNLPLPPGPPDAKGAN